VFVLTHMQQQKPDTKSPWPCANTLLLALRCVDDGCIWGGSYHLRS
jgi:hypothetical protein